MLAHSYTILACGFQALSHILQPRGLRFEVTKRDCGCQRFDFPRIKILRLSVSVTPRETVILLTMQYLRPEDFMRRYMWPNSCLPSATALIEAANTGSEGRFTLEGVENHAARKNTLA
jgi:hypothetical protein